MAWNAVNVFHSNIKYYAIHYEKTINRQRRDNRDEYNFIMSHELAVQAYSINMYINRISICNNRINIQIRTFILAV